MSEPMSDRPNNGFWSRRNRNQMATKNRQVWLWVQLIVLCGLVLAKLAFLCCVGVIAALGAWKMIVSVFG